MDRLIQQCNPVQGANWGQAPTVSLQIGPRYRSITLEAIVTNANNQIPQINDVLGLINVIANTNIQRSHTAYELDSINRSFGAQYAYNRYNWNPTTQQPYYVVSGGQVIPQPAQAGNSGGTIQTVFYITIFFREPWRESYAAKEMMGWYTAWQNGYMLSNLSLQIFVPAASANIFSSGTPAVPAPIIINAYAETDTAVGPLDKNKNPVTTISYWSRQPLVYAGAGNLVVTNLSKTDIYLQINLFSGYASGHGPIGGRTDAQLLSDMAAGGTYFDPVLSAIVTVNNKTVRNNTKSVNDQFLINDDFNEGSLAGDRLDLVFDKSDLPTDGLVMASNGVTIQDFRLTLNIGAPGNVAQNSAVMAVIQQYGRIH